MYTYEWTQKHIISIYTASYTHEPPNQVVGVGVILFGGELRGVELGGSQDLQHTIQRLGYRHRAALLGCVDDVYYLGKRKKRGPYSAEKQTLHTKTCTKSPLEDTPLTECSFLCASVMEMCMWCWRNVVWGETAK